MTKYRIIKYTRGYRIERRELLLFWCNTHQWYFWFNSLEDAKESVEGMQRKDAKPLKVWESHPKRDSLFKRIIKMFFLYDE